LDWRGEIVEQVNQFKYLGAEITRYGNLQNEVREQTMNIRMPEIYSVDKQIL